jgi:heme/copper-type cytochrome/quinol oxidase subunit 2
VITHKLGCNPLVPEVVEENQEKIKDEESKSLTDIWWYKVTLGLSITVIVIILLTLVVVALVMCCTVCFEISCRRKKRKPHPMQ